jgi:protein ImuA
MALAAAAQVELSRLRRQIAQMEGRLADEGRLILDAPASLERRGPVGLRPRPRRGHLRLGIERLDAALGGGLPLASLAEIRVSLSRDGGAAAGFVLALAARLVEAGGMPSVVWISEADLRREAGRLYAPGLIALGLDPARIVEVAARTEAEALWAFEAALGCRGVGMAVCELRQAALDLTATRRCALRARDAGVTGFLLRLGNEQAEPSAAELRFQLLPAPAGMVGGFAKGVGRMAWRLALEKNRMGPTGAFSVEWKSHERCFAEPWAEWRVEPGEGDARTHPQSVFAAPSDRPAYPASAAGGGAAGGGGGRRYAS